MPVFCVWLLPFNMKFLRFIHVVICISSSFFFLSPFLKKQSFYFEITINLLEVAKIVQRSPCTLHPFSLMVTSCIRKEVSSYSTYFNFF